MTIMHGYSDLDQLAPKKPKYEKYVEAGGCALPPDNPFYLDALPDRYPYNTAIVRAAFHVASEAHKNDKGWLQVRNPKVGVEKPIPYISHPLIVCQLLEKLGKADELNIAIALLHDAMEDCRLYVLNPALMKHHLQKAMVEAPFFIPEEDAEAIADKIYDNCDEMTNPSTEDMLGDKRSWQSSHITTMLSRAKLIKMLDQTASALEDVWFEPMERSQQQQIQFFAKALDLNKAAANTGDQTSKLAAAFFKTVYTRFRDIVNAKTPEEKEALRRGFDVDVAMEKARATMPIMLTPKATDVFSVTHDQVDRFLKGVFARAREAFGDAPASAEQTAQALESFKQHMPQMLDVQRPANVLTIFHPKLNNSVSARVAYGAASIELVSGENPPRVAAFTMISPTRHNAKLVTKINKAFIAELENLHSTMAVNIGDTEIIAGSRMVRRYCFDEPVLLSQFIQASLQAKDALAKDMMPDVDLIGDALNTNLTVPGSMTAELSPQAALQVGQGGPQPA